MYKCISCQIEDLNISSKNYEIIFYIMIKQRHNLEQTILSGGLISRQVVIWMFSLYR